MSDVAYQFLKSVFHTLPEGALPVVCGFRTDPSKVRSWTPRAVNGHWPEILDKEMNLYFSLSSIYPQGKRYYNDQDSAAALHAVMLDDIGDGEGGKSDGARVGLDPTWIIETSPGNHQYIYVLSDPVRDTWVAEHVCKAIAQQAGTDTGATNNVRWTRLPGGINNKQKYLKGGRAPTTSIVGGEEWITYSIEEIIDAFDITIPERGAGGGAVEVNVDESDPMLSWLGEQGYLKGRQDRKGWNVMVCPWSDEHSDGDTTGTAYARAGEGGKGSDGGGYSVPRFTCRHDHCSHRGYGELLAFAQDNGFNAGVYDFDVVEAEDQKQVVRMDLKGFIKRFRFIGEGPQVADLHAPRHTAMRTMQEFKAWTAPYMTDIGKERPKLVPTYGLWLKSSERGDLRGVGYEPGGDDVIADEHQELWFNSYQAPPWRVDESDGAAGRELKLIQPFLTHLEYLLPKEDEREFFLNWITYTVQSPNKRCKFTPLLVSTKHGTGRGFVVELMQELLGPQNTSVSKISTMSGDGKDGGFQNYLYRSVFCAVHEVKESSKDQYGISDKVRDILVDDHLNLNLKYGKNGMQAVYTNFLLMSNHIDALKLTEEDRRLWVSVMRDDPRDDRYYMDLYRWKDEDKNGVEALYSWLMKRNLKGWNRASRAPMTAAKRQMIASGESHAKEAFLELLESPPVDLMTESDLLSEVRRMVSENSVEEALAIHVGEIRHLLQESCVQLDGSNGKARQIKVTKSDGKKGPVRPWALANLKKWNKADGPACKKEIERFYLDGDEW